MTVMLFSGGIGSWAAARRLLDTGAATPETLTLLFTDTLIEDEDLYRFIEDAAQNLETPITRIADGRTPWEVFHDQGMIANTRADLCSRILKRDLARDWIDTQHPDGTTVAMGIDWSEQHRYDRARPRWEPHRLIAPLCDPPYLTKPDLLGLARGHNLTPPRLYDLGFPHNNCGGFCVKQGQGAFVKLLETMPDRYAHHEDEEQRFRDETGKDVAILRDRTGGTTTPLTLTELRQRHEQTPEQLDLLDLAGCGCMLD